MNSSLSDTVTAAAYRPCGAEPRVISQELVSPVSKLPLEMRAHAAVEVDEAATLCMVEVVLLVISRSVDEVVVVDAGAVVVV